MFRDYYTLYNPIKQCASAIFSFATSAWGDFLPLVDVVFLAVVANLRFDFGLAMIVSFWFYCCLLMQTIFVVPPTCRRHY